MNQPSPVADTRLPYMPVIPAPAPVVTVTPEEIANANRPSTQMLLALTATRRHVYGGTVPAAVKAARRRRNKAARAARRAAR